MATIAANCPNIKVTVCDINPKQVARWNSDKLPIYEPGLDEIVFKVRNKNLFFTTDLETAIKESGVLEECDMVCDRAFVISYVCPLFSQLSLLFRNDLRVRQHSNKGLWYRCWTCC